MCELVHAQQCVIGACAGCCWRKQQEGQTENHVGHQVNLHTMLALATSEVLLALSLRFIKPCNSFWSNVIATSHICLLCYLLQI